jgi:dTDP-4-amino-4,6-dideoxygalactose transaminase
MIPQFKVRMAPDASSLVKEVLDSGFIGQGPKVEEFEDILWKELGSSVRPVTVNSCTSAIDLALDLIGVRPGDEVISTPQTCFASQVGAIHKGATIRWADIDPITGCMDPNSIEKLITDKTKAIIAVNWAGRYCDFASLKSFGIPVVEDAAHCWDIFNDSACERGDYTCYSFQAIKFLTTGDGGILIPPKDKEKDARLLRWYGLDRTKGQSFRCTQNIKEAGFKYQMNDIAAAIGIKNISYARESVRDHRKNSKIFINRIRNNDIIIPEWDENGSYWIFSLHVINGRKDEFLEYMKNNSITVSPVHYRNDEYDCTIEFREFDLPGVNQFSKTQVCIPNGWWLTKNEINRIVDKVNEF